MERLLKRLRLTVSNYRLPKVGDTLNVYNVNGRGKEEIQESTLVIATGGFLDVGAFGWCRLHFPEGTGEYGLGSSHAATLNGEAFVASARIGQEGLFELCIADGWAS
jgi:hypothetical protein